MEIFTLDPGASRRVLDKLAQVQGTAPTRRTSQRTLGALAAAAAKDDENLMPYLIDCCHAYATVGEMVQRLKNQWGEFQEPVRL